MLITGLALSPTTLLYSRHRLTPFLGSLRNAAAYQSRKHITSCGDSSSGSAMKASDLPEATAAAAPNTEDVVLQYIILRRDLWTELGWPLGSVVAQGCHAATAALWLSRDSQVTLQYCSPERLDHMHKVVLEVKGEAQLRSLSEKMSEAGVLHKLWVEQPEDFPTCIATAPCPKSMAQPIVKRLKLCKGT